ncbi:FIST N-terminal domain-containing protein [Sulfurimonas sp.]|uniref:FIST N-terminal domain-containing protein n=1 Tax=Sulfurimonas sp. TaxID=2022749 RepID=UPI002610595B|nr:FIST N-terminal domain-containing protein [Sulfurimonas sp.]
MKHYTFTLKNTHSYLKASKEAKKQKYTAQLIQIFSSLTNKTTIQNLLDKIAHDFPQAQVIGTTTAGEISHAKIYENETIISCSLFKTSKLKTAYIKEITKKSGKKLSKKIDTKNTKAAIVLSEGLKGKDYEGFIHAIHKQNPELVVAGGLAGDNFRLKNTFIFLNQKIYTQGSVAVSFSGKKLFASNEYNLNWAPIGKEFTISSVKNNKIYEIDNKNALKVFKHYLGSELFKNNEVSLPDIQLLYQEGETVVSRTPMTVDKDAIVLAAPIKEGQKVKFGFSNAASVILGANEIKNKLANKPAEAIYIYSCIARKTLLGKRLEREFKYFEDIAPTSGFFTYGEYYSTNKTNALLNCTTTILVLSESKQTNKTHKQTMPKNLENTTFQALTHFIKQTANELDKNTKLLQEYKNVVDESSLISKSDINGTITYVNKNFCDVSKYSKDELIGANHNIIRNPKMPKSTFKNMWKILREKKVYKGILSNKAKDGSLYYVDATIMPILDKEGKIEEFISIRKNITKEIESKLRIKEKEKLIKAIFDNQDSIVILASKDKGIQKVNKKLFEYLEYKDFEDFKKQHNSVCELFIREKGYINIIDNPNIFEYVALNAVNTNKVKMKIKDGTIHTFKIAVKPINYQYIINLYDITDFEDALLKANLSEKAKATFLANMSHEIRTPLNGIIGFTDILRKKKLDQESQKYVQIVHNNSETLLNIVNNILDFSKIEDGKFTLNNTVCNFKQNIQNALETFESLAYKKNIFYNVKIDKNIPTQLQCDIQRLKQVINNLISNAIKFTPENGKIDVQIKLQNITNNSAKIYFSVSDNGIGIAKDKISSIFESFSQADNSISKKYGGTGLGLAISNQYIKLMNSNIEVQTQENKGSTFYFSLQLPIVKLPNAVDIQKTVSNKYEGKVLIVEDNTTNQLLLSLLLEQKNISCDIANNGKEALELIEKNKKYALLFMDINMPILDGITTTKILREKNYTQPIVSLSANVIKKDKEKFRKAGMDANLNKPIILSELETILDTYMQVDKPNTAFDIIHPKTIFEKMFITDEKMIHSLLNTFATSATKMLHELQTKGLDEKLIHTIKGVSGNLRFEHLYQLSVQVEKELSNMSEKEKQENETLLISHLTKLIAQVKELN